MKVGLNRTTFTSPSTANATASSSSSSTVQPAASTATTATAAVAAVGSRPEPVIVNINLSQLPAILETSEIVPVRVYPDDKLAKLMSNLAALTGYDRKDLKLKVGRRVANNDHLTIQDSGLVITNPNSKTQIYLVIA